MEHLEQQTDHKLIRKYLVGALDKKGQERLEMRLLSDAEFREEVAIVQDELIDDYISGALSGHERERFEEHLRATPGLVQKLQFARSLDRYMDRVSTPVAVVAGAVPRGPRKRINFPRLWNPVAVSLSAVVVVALAASLIYLFFISSGELPAPPPQAVNPRHVFEEELARLNKPASDTSDPLGGPLETSAIVTLTPKPIRVRDDGGAIREIIPESAGVMQVRLESPAGEYRAYRAVIQTDESLDLAEVGGLTTRTVDGHKMVILNLPGKFVPPRGYQVRLYGETAAGQYEDAGLYPFQVVKHKEL